MIDGGLALLIEEEPIFIPIIYEYLLSRLNTASGLYENFLSGLNTQLCVVGHSVDVWKLLIGFEEFKARQ
jgi:hypothetical protein